MKTRIPSVYLLPETGENKIAGLEVYFSCNTAFNPELPKDKKLGNNDY